MPRPRLKRLLRISLRMTFVLTTILCIWLGLEVRQVERQKEVVVWVEGMGGSVLYDYEYSSDDGFNYDDPKPSVPDWLCKLIGIDYFSDVTVVILDGRQTAELSPLANLTNLEALELDHTSVSDLGAIAGLENLESLLLLDNPVTDLSSLRGLPNLQRLFFYSCPVSDLSSLANLTSLSELHLNDTQVADLTPLSNLARMKILSLSRTAVDDEEIEELALALPQCEIIR